MAEFDLIIDGNGSGPFTEFELVGRLEQYRAHHPEDPRFGRVRVVELPVHGTVGRDRSVFEVVPDAPRD